MNVTLNRKQLAEILRHRDTTNIRQAIKRGSIIEDKAGINLKDPANRQWLENQIQAGRQKGFLIDINLDDTPKKQGTGSQETSETINRELKKARTELVREQTRTAQLNREIAFGNYLKTSHIIEAVTVYLDQTMNVGNTNLSNVASRFCQQHGIDKPEEIIKLKSELTETLNMAIEAGRKEVMKTIDRMVSDQIEKLATK
ncbi:hypothetical protein [Marinilabilia salmonicolor]|uniref:hypothetical protein n=1 Tax=Marinilabilia salmonicolor TaxID=989 RepID=UPI00029B1151|nr:hypothetical protein [Marinilabilia salmonicolor]